MSVKYICDVCNREILLPDKRVIINTTIIEDDRRNTYHACRTCYNKHVKDLFNGAFERVSYKAPSSGLYLLDINYLGESND